MSPVSINPSQLTRLAQLAAAHGLQFVRIFGSGVGSLERARDVDLVIDRVIPDMSQLSHLVSEFSVIFAKPIDLIELRSHLPPLLVREIAKNSVPLWEHPVSGRARYADLMDRLCAVAEDERLSYTPELKLASVRSLQKRLSHGS